LDTASDSTCTAPHADARDWTLATPTEGLLVGSLAVDASGAALITASGVANGDVGTGALAISRGFVLAKIAP
jgi:hypothetical protein